MNKFSLHTLYKIFKIIYLSLVGYFFIKYSHILNTTLEKLLSFILGLVSLSHAVVPILKLLKPEDDDNLDNND